ncbi:MAG: hypothetical protein WCI04_05225 [archaeon]
MKKQLAYSIKQNFFTPENILSPKQALFFVIEEAIMILIIVIQLYRFLGIQVIDKQIYFFTSPIFTSSILMFVATLALFILGYLVIAIRDNNVWLIHKNFSRLIFGTAKLKVEFATKKKIALLSFELVYTLIVAISLMIYIDPDINLVPAPYNYIGFAFLILIGFVLFSHTKNFRALVYGPTPIQKRMQFGSQRLRRFTNKKTGSIRIAPRDHYRKK